MIHNYVSRQDYLKTWACQMADFEESGLSVKAFCSTRNIPISTFTMHRREVRKAALLLPESSCQPAVPVASPEIHLAHVDLANANGRQFADDVCLATPHGNIVIHNSASPDLVKIILEAFLHAE